MYHYTNDFSKQVSQARTLVKQIDLQREEMENAEKPEYTTESIPLLLHQVRGYISTFSLGFFFFVSTNHEWQK